MTRKDVKLIAARLNNPILLLAIQRHESHDAEWEEVMNQAVVELAKQNDYFLEKLISRDEGLLSDKPTHRPYSIATS